MSQVTIYLPDELERELRAAAKKAGKSFSAYIAELASRRKKPGRGWPKAFKATFGAWEGEFEEPPELDPEEREGL
jgi:predicted CopG family antitoxin